MDPNQQQTPPEQPVEQPAQAPVVEQPFQAPPAEQPVQFTQPVQPVQPIQPIVQPQPTATPFPMQPPVEAPASPVAPTETSEHSFQWQAPEYLTGARSTMWYIGFWGAVVVLMALAFFLIKSITFAVLIPIMAAALTIYTHRPARMMQYVISAKGLYINDQIHALGEFKGFGVRQDEAMPSLMFIPTKRFRPALTVYFPQEIGEQLVDFIGVRLPIQDTKLDAFDKVVRRLHL